MDSALYKDLITSRGLKYHYYVSPAYPLTNPTLLLLHGFPSTSNDWRYQVAYFQARGYGLIVPDMLGYGGTDKPTDPSFYRRSLVCRDLVDILEAEGVEQSVVIGHDWGSAVTSRLANLYPDRFSAFAFLAVSYNAPSPDADYQKTLILTKQTFGYELFGYWRFFSEEGTDKLVEEHWDSFLSILFPEDPKLWITDFAPLGAAKAYITADKKSARPSWLSREDFKDISNVLRKGGLAAPFCWYKIMTNGVTKEDDKLVPSSAYDVNKPVFFGATLQDYICLDSLGKAYTARYCKGSTTIRSFDTGHWVMYEAKDEVNKELEEWLKGLNL